MKKLGTPLALSLVLAFMGFILVTAGWSTNASWQPDSYFYSGAAANIVEGHGVSFVDKKSGELMPLTHYPPLTSLAVAFFSKFAFLSIPSAFMTLNALSLALIAFVFAYQAINASNQTRLGLFFATTGCLSIVLSKHLLEAFQFQQSEPLFLLLVVLQCSVIYAYMQSYKIWLLVLSSILAGFAFLTRYVGAYLIISTSLLFLISRHKPLVVRIRDIFIYGAIFSISFFGWFLRNYLLTGSLHTHKMTEGAVERTFAGINEITYFILPGSLPFGIRIFALVCFILFCSWVLISTPYKSQTQKITLQSVYTSSAITYLLFQICMCFVIKTRLNTRTLLPFILLIFMGYIIALCSRSKPDSNCFKEPAKKLVVLMLSGFVTLSFVRAVEHTYNDKTTFPNRQIEQDQGK